MTKPSAWGIQIKRDKKASLGTNTKNKKEIRRTNSAFTTLELIITNRSIDSECFVLLFHRSIHPFIILPLIPYIHSSSSIQLPIHPSSHLHKSAHPSVDSSVNLSTSPTIRQHSIHHIHQPIIHLPICLPIIHPICQLIHPPTHHPQTHSPIHPSTNPSSIYQSANPSSIHPSANLSIHPIRHSSSHPPTHASFN